MPAFPRVRRQADHTSDGFWERRERATRAAGMPNLAAVEWTANPGFGCQGGPVSYFAHPTAIVDSPCEIGDGTKIWHFVHVSKGARIGSKCIFGQNVMIADDVVIGNNVKVQNNVSIYPGTVVEDDVFLGPSCVLTNVSNPRSQVLRHSLYERTLIRR